MLHPTQDQIREAFDRIADKMRVGDFFYDEVLSIHRRYEGHILDVGCGQGVLLEKLRGRGTFQIFTGVDISPRVLEFAHRRVPEANLLVGSANDLPFEDSQFDFVFMTDILQYLPHYDGALKEARRVLRPNGILICNFANSDWLLFGDDYFKIRKKIELPVTENFFSFQVMVSVLERAGFRILRYRGAECFRYYAPYHKYEMWLAAIIPWMHRSMKKVVFKVTP